MEYIEKAYLFLTDNIYKSLSNNVFSLFVKKEIYTEIEIDDNYTNNNNYMYLPTINTIDIKKYSFPLKKIKTE